MNKTIVIGLSGHAGQYRLEEAAYDRLSRYLDQAGSGLQGDPDRAEVLGDLERSVGDKLGVLLGSTDRLVTATDIDGILDEIGAVDTGQDPATQTAGAQDASTRGAPTASRRRRLHRVREGQEIAGVCTGLAAYAEIDVGWVRTVFVLGTLVTAGLLGLVYIALVFILPIDATRENGIP
jgi:phage shock protein PspC (stress-responsive transcriptional regulator)